jgi:hybrid polyketide synthase/nonribosomal peptide synthetase ACE1
LDLIAIPYASTVLSLTDLDEPVFKNITPAKLEALKTLWRQAFNIVWVTQGARAAEPYSSMMIGLGRAMIHEYPTISLQILDVDTIEDEDRSAQRFIEELLRLELLSAFNRGAKSDIEFLCSLESEVSFEGNARLIPRLYMNDEASARYNSARRPITKQLTWPESTVVLSPDGDSYELQKPSPLRLPTLPCSHADNVTMQVSSFIIQRLDVDTSGKLMLCAGVDNYTGKPLLALSRSMESRPTVPSNWTLPLPQGCELPRIVGAVGAQLVAAKIIKLASLTGTLIIHEATALVADALDQQAHNHTVRLVFTTSTKNRVRSGWLYVPQHLPERLLKNALPTSSTIIFDLSHAPGSVAVGKLMRKCLTKSCAVYSSNSLYGTAADEHPDSSSSNLVATFKTAFDAVLTCGDHLEDPEIVDLTRLHEVSVANTPLAVVVCSAAQIPVNIQAIDSGIIFQGDKTYLLIGMSGQVGRSLCQWMVEHGARYVVLTSRRPQVHAEFIASMERLGATVKALPL